MKKLFCISLFWVFAFFSFYSYGQQEQQNDRDYPIRAVPFTSVKFTDTFWAPRIMQNQQITIPIALKHCYNTRRVDNFKKAGGLMPGYFDTEFTFDDTDIYKIIEGISYSIQMYPNKQLDNQMDTLIYYIEKAQEPDGYLYTPRTAGKPGAMHSWVGKKRWEKDPDLSHELYNCGHLYEAAVAHYQATGKRSLLDVAVKNADLLVKEFGPEKLAYEPGHQVVEMGLVKMYRVTGKIEYLNLAKYFLDLKGHGKRGEYSQSHKPVIEQDEAVGHAVRAAYMYSGMTDVAALTGNQDYLHAIDKIWENVVTKKLYITGGIGATAHGEAFGKNYELPNMSAYCETCASIANVYWNHRLFLLHGDTKYLDVLERTLYNGVLSGISLSGDRFFYPNPLESMGQYERSEWFGCACCPSNICRFIPSVPGYVYAQKDDKVYVNLFVNSETDINLKKNKIKLLQKTNYPWDGNIVITVEPQNKQNFDMLIRVPGWVQNRPVPSDLYNYADMASYTISVKINGKEINAEKETDGYIHLSQKWSAGDKIEINFPMQVRRTLANELVKADKGRVSIERGPIVYCIEGVDNNDKVLNAVFPDNASITAGTYRFDDLNGIVPLSISGTSTTRDINGNIVEDRKEYRAIPYYAWANRGASEMAVWIPRSPELTRPSAPVSFCSAAKISASKQAKSLKSINDGFWPFNSNDRDTPFYSMWDKKGTEEWVEYDFGKVYEISSASVYWFDDKPWGGTKIPASWKVQYFVNGQWVDVKAKSDYKVELNTINKIEFEPVRATKVKLVVQLAEGESVGIYEFEVK